MATAAAYGKFSIPGGDSSRVVPTAKLHKRLKRLLSYFSPAQLQKLTHYYMPVGKKVVVVGGTLHGCELTEFVTKRGRQAMMVHNGPREELGKGMIVDDLVNLWPWLKKWDVPIYAEVTYDRVTDKGLVITTKEGKSLTLVADNILPTQDLVPNTELVNRLKSLVPEVHSIGSSKDPGLIVDAVRDGAKIGYAI
jgi:thioredoxin reductase